MQTDGYAAYNKFENQEGITLLACMAHARRKFDQAKDNDPNRAVYALNKIQELYDLERRAKEEELSFMLREELRMEQSVPLPNSTACLRKYPRTDEYKRVSKRQAP